MLALERRNEILRRLALSGKVIVSDLSRDFSVSEETIRRDLEKLDAEGLARKTYGGAVSPAKKEFDLPFNLRKSVNVEEKRKIAQLLSDIVSDGDTIFLDASSTAIFAVGQLKEKKELTVITNSVEILLELSDMAGWNVISTGGLLREGTLSLTGTTALKTVQNYHADLAVFSAAGLDANFGVSETTEFNAAIKQEMTKNSEKTILVLDHTKFDRVSFARVCAPSSLDAVVTDQEPSGQWTKIFKDNNVELYF